MAAVAVAPRSLKEMQQNRQTLGQVRRVVGTLGTISALSASAAVWATKDEGQKRTLALQKNGKAVSAVTFQKAARMSRLLNTLDVIGSHRLGKNVIASEGDVVQAPKGGTWHRGTSVIKTNEGVRTITHVQSLKLPGHHYYFDRKLSDKAVAGVVTGRNKAQQMKGYVGEVHSMESLVPTWGAAKKAMITTRLYHPSPQAKWSLAKEPEK